MEHVPDTQTTKNIQKCQLGPESPQRLPRLIYIYIYIFLQVAVELLGSGLRVQTSCEFATGNNPSAQHGIDVWLPIAQLLRGRFVPEYRMRAK